jgi:type IV pilus assembly protein PilA
MNSTTCPRCGLTSWAAAVCKGCGQPLTGGQNWGAPPQAPRPYAPDAAYNEASSDKSNGLAIASLVIGIFSFLTFGLFGVGALAGLVLGIVALRRVKRAPAVYGGQGLAIAGIVTSALSFAIVVPIAIIAAIAIPNLMASRRAADEAAAISSLRQLYIAEVTYHETAGSSRNEYGSLSDLQAQGLIDERTADVTHHGYRFEFSSTGRSFEVAAVPVEYPTTGRRSFYIATEGVLHAADLRGAKADADDPVIGSVQFGEDGPHYSPQQNINSLSSPEFAPSAP